MMINLKLVQQSVPVPRFFETEFRKRAQELIYDPLFHEFFERGLASLDGCHIVRRKPGDNRKKMPIPPEPLVYEVLCILRIVLHESCENGMTDLRVPGFVRLNTSDHLLKRMIGGSMRQRGKTHELKVCEPRFKHYVCSDVVLDRILPNGQFVEKVPRRYREPVIRVIKLMDPVELWVPPDQLMEQEERDLSMAIFVQCAERRHTTPGGVAAKTSTPQIAD